MIERMSRSKVRLVLAIVFVIAMAFTALCGIAAAQYCGLYPGSCGTPVTVAGPCGAVASAGGVTACAGATGAIASAGGITAGASALFPVAFAGPVAPFSPFNSPGLLI